MLHIIRAVLTYFRSLTMSQIPNNNNNSHKEWLEKSIKEGSIYCCPDSDIKLDRCPIGHGGFGVVHKATIKQQRFAKAILGKDCNILSDMTVAVKTYFNYENSEENVLQLVREVDIIIFRYVCGVQSHV